MKATEKTKAAYAMLRFGGDNAMLGGVNVRGNIGVRIVRTDIDSTGSVGFPQPNVFTQLLLTPCGTPLGPDAVVNPACYLTDDLIAFADGSGTPNNFKASYTNVLPSLNVRFGLDDHNFVRFGYSRAMARPDFGLLRNYVSIQAPLLDTSAHSTFLTRAAARPLTTHNITFPPP